MPEKGKITWPMEDFDLACEMWQRGDGGTAIGNMIGRSRRSVIGMMYRHGVKSPNKGGNTGRSRLPRAPKPARPARTCLIGKGPQSLTRKPPSPASIKALPQAPTPLNVTFADLDDGMCRWPVGAGHHHFCGAATGRGRTYCPHHDTAKTASGMATLRATAEAAKAAAAGAQQ
jgi:hypothetical protein